MRTANQATLQRLGVSVVDAAGFSASPAFTPWQQTLFVTFLQSLAAVAGLHLLVRDATAASTGDTDAIFYAETAKLLSLLKATQGKIARIVLQNIVPCCILADCLRAPRPALGLRKPVLYGGQVRDLAADADGGRQEAAVHHHCHHRHGLSPVPS